MTAATQSRTRKGDWFLFDFALIVGIFAILVIVLLSAGHIGPTASKRAKLASDFNQVQTAVLRYYIEYSEYPVVPDNASLIKKLTQDNPHGITFLNVKASDLNAQGKMIDPWGTPLQISVGADGVLHMRSAGPDKIFGTADDITSR